MITTKKNEAAYLDLIRYVRNHGTEKETVRVQELAVTLAPNYALI